MKFSAKMRNYIIGLGLTFLMSIPVTSYAQDCHKICDD